MCDALAAERHESCQRVGIDAVFRQPTLVKPDEVKQIAASRVPGQEYLAAAAIVLRDVLIRPCHRCRSVIEDIVDLGLGQQAVVGRDDHEAAVPELRVDMLLAALDAAAVEPYHHGRILGVSRIIHVEFAALLGIAHRRLAIRDVVL